MTSHPMIPSPFTPSADSILTPAQASYATLQYKIAALTDANNQLGQEVFARMQAADAAMERAVVADKLMSRCYIAFTSNVTEEFVKDIVADLSLELGIDAKS